MESQEAVEVKAGGAAMQYPLTGDGMRKVSDDRVVFSDLGLWFDLVGQAQIKLGDGLKSTKRYHLLELVG